MKYPLILLVVILCFFSCKKKSNSSSTPTLDSPAYSFFTGSIGTNDLSMTFTNDGNIALLGQSVAGNVLIYKLSPSGNQLLRKEITLNGIPGYGSPTVHSIVQTTDGGYMMCGTMYVPGTYMGGTTTSSDVYLLKVNSAGDTLWSRRYGGSQEDYGSMMIKTKDGNYLLCGITYSFTTEGFDDIYLVKVNDNGDTLWTHPYLKHEQQTPFDLLEMKNGDYLVTGTDEPTGDGRIAYMLRVDKNGNKLWDNSVGPVDISHWKWAYCSAELSNGDLMIGGETDSKLMLIRTDNAGNLTWEKTYAGPDSSYRCGLSMKVRTDNSVTITGGCSEIIYPTSNCFLFKADQNGNQLFFKSFPGIGSMTGVNLLVNNSGDNIITGYQYMGTSSTNIFLTRTDANGNYK